MYLPSGDHFGESLRDAILSGAMRVMSPRSVAMVRIWPRAEMTARRPDGEMSKLSTSLVTVSISSSLSFSSVVMSSLISLSAPGGDVELPDAEVVLVDDRPCRRLDIEGQNRLPSVCFVTCTGWPRRSAGIL